ncbi:MAG: DUF2723 domain-containing protein [Vicinamibacteria bacterium]|nr:DUF2723 domain-containing protein [Vicinamibacteria bacterium]
MSPSLRRDLTSGALAASVSATSLVAYWLTHGSGPFWQDSGLFLAALKAGGGLLPPGYPVYLLLGRPFVTAFEWLLPGRPFAEAGNMFSAVWASLAAGLTCLSILALRQPGYRFLSAKSSSEELPSSAGWFGAWLGGVLTGLSYSLWFQALTAEAYALNAFFSAAVLYLVIRLGASGPIGADPPSRERRLALLLLVVHGLSFGNHPVTVVFLPAIAWLAWKGRAALANRRFLALALAAYGGSALVPYLYLPWAASAFPQTPYSGVASITGLAAQISGSQWSADARNYGWSFIRFKELPGQIWQELFGMGVLGLLVGLRWVARERPALLRFLALVLVPAFLLPLVYLRGGEYDFWLLTAYMALFVVSGAGLCAVFDRIQASRWPAGLRGVGILAVAVLTLIAPLRINPPLVDRTGYFVPEDFGRNLYRHLAPGAVFIAVSDQENALTYYLDVVEHERPDVVRIDAGVATTPWFARQLKSRYPAFEFEDISQGRATPPSTEEWVAALLRSSLKTRSVYMTTRLPVDIPAGATWTPAGGLWKLTAGPAGIDVHDWDYEYRNPDPMARPARDHAPEKMPDGSIRREPYTAQIRRFHAQAWTNLGDWSLEHDDFPQASSAYAKALATDPTLDQAGIFFGLGKSLFVLDRPNEALPYLERVGERLAPPLVAETALYLGQIYAGRGDAQKAEHYFDTVRLLAPEIGARLPPRAPAKR